MNLPDLLECVCPRIAAVAFMPDSLRAGASTLQDILSGPGFGHGGTGFALAEDTFLTCNHVVEPLIGLPGTIMLLICPERGDRTVACRALWVARDRKTDLALVRTEPVQIQVASLDLDPAPPRPGTDVVAVGVPLPEVEVRINPEHGEANLDACFRVRATRGIVASRVREDGRFEVDTQFNPGLSGGPIFDVETGRLVGVVQGSVVRRAGAAERDANLGVGIALGAVRPHLEELRHRAAQFRGAEALATPSARR